MQMSSKPEGWRNKRPDDPKRHSDAARGIESGRFSEVKNPIYPKTASTRQVFSNPLECGEGYIWDGTRGERIPKNDSLMIGDGKLPNRYWVTLQDVEYVGKPDEDGVMCFDGDENTGKNGKTVAVFDTYEEAKKFLNRFNIDDFVTVDGKSFQVTCKTIEDRLSGELLEEAVYNSARTVTNREVETREDVKFTREKMEKQGATFR
jgi:hypothetical protein